MRDQIDKGNLKVEYFPNAEMIADFMSKPFQRKLFQKLGNLL